MICSETQSQVFFEFGRDLLIVLPTGYGKSIIYQSLPWLSKFLKRQQKQFVLVISPLVSLMKNQVALMNKKGISAIYYMLEIVIRV